MDDNRNVAQLLHPIACHHLFLAPDEWSSTPTFLKNEVMGVELQPEADTIISFYDGGPQVYLRGGGTFLYDNRQYLSLKATPAPGSPGGLLIVTELG